jgi:Tfp pilus assembly protein PilN
MKKLWIAGGSVIVCLLLVLLGLFMFKDSNTDPEQQSETATANEINGQLLVSKNSKQSCWFSYNGRVFDITRKFTVEDSNQEALAKICGTSVDTLPTDFKNIDDLVPYQIGILVP